MSNNDYVKPPKKSVVKNTAGALKGAYSYLHPDYWRRKLIHLVIVVPVVLFGYTLIDAFFMPWKHSIIDTIGITILTILSAYFYPFSLWWYKQSFTGTTINDMVYFGTSSSEVVSRRMKDLLMGIVIAGVLAPILGPLALRKCRKKNMIIGEEGDFKKKE